MKMILAIVMMILSLTSCSRVETEVCEVFYQIYFKNKNNNKCLNDLSQIQEYYQTDSIKIISKINGITNEYAQFGDLDQDSCYFIVADISIPTISFIVGNIHGKMDSISTVSEKNKIVYYLNGVKKYEINDACKKGVIECIIEI